MGKKQFSRATRWRGSFLEMRPGEAFIAGWNGVAECLRSPRVRVKKLWLVRARVPPERRALLAGSRAEILEPDGGAAPHGPLSQGIGALVELPESPNLENWLDQVRQRKSNPLLVALDQVEDPMNLGQILRTCEGAGVDGLVITRHRAVHLNQTVAQVSQGAFAWLPVIEVVNLRSALEMTKQRDFWVFGLDSGPRGKNWYECDLRGPTVLVFGAEGQGLRNLTRKICDQLVGLPMRGRIESLNVAAATAAVLYEALRQRLTAPENSKPAANKTGPVP